MFDCHNHTSYSHDSTCDIDALCEAAIHNGLCGISITDHCDIEFYHEHHALDTARASAAAAADAAERYRGRLHVFSGVEMGEAFWEPAYAREVLSSCAFDIVLGSVHAVRYAGWTQPYSQIDFAAFDTAMLDAYMERYYLDLLAMLDGERVDVLAHLTCPLRYIDGKYGIGFGYMRNWDQIDAILHRLVDRQIALELNTSGLSSRWQTFMPQRHILERYFELGGRLVTIGSDSHLPQYAGKGLKQALSLLQQCGFTHYCYYKGRQPVEVPLGINAG